MNNKRISITLIFVWLLAGSAVYAQIKKENFDTLINRLGETFLKNKEAVGLSIGLYNNGQTYFYNYGTTQREKTILPTQHTVYEIGSITKAFVSLVLANAVIEKKVKLDDDIRKYLDGNYPNLEYKGKPVSLLELSNTTSELPNWLPLLTKQITDAPADSVPHYIEKTYQQYSQKDIEEALGKVLLDTASGNRVAHSNAAALLLSAILERVYNKPIEHLVARYILKPNKMNSSSFLASKTNSKLLAVGYNDAGKQMPYFATSFLKGVGGLNSTSYDLVNFIRYQLNATKAAVKLSHQKTFNTGWGHMGLSWQIYKWDNGNHQFWVTGGTYGFTSYLIFYPEINSGIVLLSNEADPSSSEKIGDIATAIFQFITTK